MTDYRAMPQAAGLEGVTPYCPVRLALCAGGVVQYAKAFGTAARWFRFHSAPPTGETNTQWVPSAYNT